MKINSGKSCKPAFIVSLQMFNRACDYLPLSSVLLCRPPTIQAKVKIHDSVYNSVTAKVDFYSLDREAETLHCSCIRQSQRSTQLLTPSRGEQEVNVSLQL